MEEISFYDLLRFYVKKWLIIVSAVMIGAIAGIVYTYYVQAPEYDSKATLLLVGTNRTSANQDSVVLNNYVQLFTSRRVLDPVIDEQEYDEGYDALVASTTAVNPKGTDIINVSVSTSDPKKSKALLESNVQSFRDQAKTMYGDNSIKINLVDSASLPDQPSNVKPVVQIGLATAATTLLAIVGLFFVYDYRRSIRGRVDVQWHGVEVVSDAIPENSQSTKDSDILDKLHQLEPEPDDVMFDITTTEEGVATTVEEVAPEGGDSETSNSQPAHTPSKKKHKKRKKTRE